MFMLSEKIARSGRGVQRTSVTRCVVTWLSSYVVVLSVFAKTMKGMVTPAEAFRIAMWMIDRLGIDKNACGRHVSFRTEHHIHDGTGDLGPSHGRGFDRVRKVRRA